jgi:hypothetical protein
VEERRPIGTAWTTQVRQDTRQELQGSVTSPSWPIASRFAPPPAGTARGGKVVSCANVERCSSLTRSGVEIGEVAAAERQGGLLRSVAGRQFSECFALCTVARERREAQHHPGWMDGGEERHGLKPGAHPMRRSVDHPQPIPNLRLARQAETRIPQPRSCLPFCIWPSRAAGTSATRCSTGARATCTSATRCDPSSSPVPLSFFDASLPLPAVRAGSMHPLPTTTLQQQQRMARHAPPHSVPVLRHERIAHSTLLSRLDASFQPLSRSVFSPLLSYAIYSPALLRNSFLGFFFGYKEILRQHPPETHTPRAVAPQRATQREQR